MPIFIACPVCFKLIQRTTLRNHCRQKHPAHYKPHPDASESPPSTDSTIVAVLPATDHAEHLLSFGETELWEEGFGDSSGMYVNGEDESDADDTMTLQGFPFPNAGPPTQLFFGTDILRATFKSRHCATV